LARVAELGFGAFSFVPKAAWVPAVHYKSGTNPGTWLHRVFHFHPAASGRFI